MRTFFAAVLLSIALVSPVLAAEVSGSITDRSGGVLREAVVRLLNVATGQEVSVTADAGGRFRFSNLRLGIYRLSTSLVGFSESTRSVIVTDDTESLTVDFELELGSVRADVTVSAARGERGTEVVPIRADTVASDVIREAAPTGTGDALVRAPGVTLVGSGPFQTRPRLRGLDSTRVLVLVDGARLNNARTATDRAGAEVGLVDIGSVEDLEVLGGAGSVLYGTDALAGTINIITNRARISDKRLFTVGFDGLYTSNEDGGRGTLTLGASDKRWAFSFKGGSEQFGNYKSGKQFQETSQPLLDNGTIVNAGDTIDKAFGFNFHAFPDPFNAPFTRTSAEVPNSGMTGSSANATGLAMFTPSQTLEVKYQHRRAENVGFPDFAQPYFFQSITLPWSQLDKFSASYSFTNLARWMTRLTVTPYYQRQDRLLRNDFPVAQFPVPSPAFFPIAVNRINIFSDTRQQVWTPGVDAQATFLPRPDNVLTVGTTMFRDRSEDERSTTTYQNTIGQVALGPTGPAATVFPIPQNRLEQSVTHPVRVPNASFRDLAVFALDEWNVNPVLRLTAGLRLDGYRVTNDPTTGYDGGASLVVGAVPPIDPATLPNPNGSRISRTAVTGEVGAVLWSERPVSFFGHYVRSYRHPNLEEMLFSGPATVGNIVPNVTVEPETGHNVDGGARIRTTGFVGSIAYFNNTYRNFISTEVVANATSPNASISQAINFARVRIQGVEAEGSAPLVLANLNWLPSAAVAYNLGTVLAASNPLTGVSLDGQPQDNITPWKVTLGLRANDRRERWWAAYNLRTQTAVTRVSPLLSGSPFLIAQDLLGLGGFSVHRIAGGYDWRKGNQRLGLGVAVDNLTDKFYREQFQFAAARGRTVSVMVTVRGVQ